MRIVFATNNLHKLSEIQSLLGGEFNLDSLHDIGCTDELPENQTTLEGNAYEKASYVFNKFKIDCFADDTGLEVDVLNGRPGVYSARYAGEYFASQNERAEANMKKLLMEMKGKKDRNAQFRTVISLILHGTEYRFEGIAKGTILEERRGGEGFGYDPVFLPDGCSKTFAEMSLDEKNVISHRAIATKKLVEFLKHSE
jgi:XTP/dITP diphosphohydrolase